jgi:imidazolonepropionase-like amidohydrolase
VLYGTDFGNTTVAGIDAQELELLAEAGLDGAAILEAATAAPAAFWGLDGFGCIEVGAEAHVLVLDADPTLDPTTLSRIVRVL